MYISDGSGYTYPKPRLAFYYRNRYWIRQIEQYLFIFFARYIFHDFSMCLVLIVYMFLKTQFFPRKSGCGFMRSITNVYKNIHFCGELDKA